MADMLLFEQTEVENCRSTCLKLVTHWEGRTDHQHGQRAPFNPTEYLKDKRGLSFEAVAR